MCTDTCIEFGERVIRESDVGNKDVIELGARDLNGSLRGHVESLGPKSYVGVDIEDGDEVDVVLDARSICERFGRESFDVVVSTELLEHVEAWQSLVSQMKNVLKSGGVLIITTRSRGTPLHDYPGDFWRFEISDMKKIFSDMKITDLEIDPYNLNELPGVFMRAVKPKTFDENDLGGHKLYSIITGARELNEVS
jgi:SAM-dependent methyltransferase